MRAGSGSGPVWHAALLLLVPLLTGCIGQGSLDGDGGIAPLEDLAGAAAVTWFRGDGTVLPAPPAAAGALGDAVHGLTGFPGGEPTLGITQDGALFAAAGDAIIRSRDRGATWEDVWRLVPQDDGVVPGNPRGVVRSYDPLVWVDPVTDRVFADPMFPPLACSHLAWSDDGGASWFERPGVCHPPPMDYQKLTSGVPGPGANPLAGSNYPTVLYQCYNGLVFTACGMSYDGGLTWVAHQVVADTARHGCEGLGGYPRVSPDGVVFVPLLHTCRTPTLAVSLDSGLTWDLLALAPEAAADDTDVDISFAHDGTVFVAYRSRDQAAMLLRSSDGGETWHGPWRIAPREVRSTVFQVVEAGEDGRLAAAFLGTRDSDAGPDAAPPEARWHLWLVTSEDALAEVPMFAARQVTPDDDPVQIGRVCMGGALCDDGSRNLLDFIDAAVAPDGTFHVIYTEGCTEGCAGNADAADQDSRAREVAHARLDGWALVASG